MNVQNLSLNELLIILIILLTNVFLFVFINWLQFKQYLKSYTIFDIAFINIIGMFVLARLLGVLENIQNYFNNPLAIFNVLDGHFLYSGLFLGVMLSTSLIYLYSNQKKQSFFLLDRLILTLVILISLNPFSLYILKIFGLFKSDIIDFQFQIIGSNIDMMPVQLAVFGIMLIWANLAKLVKTEGRISLVFSGVFVLLLIFKNALSAYVLQNQNINMDSIVGLFLFLFVFIQYLKLYRKNKSLGVNSMQTKRQPLPSKAMPRKYLQSYTKTDVSNAALSINEKLNSTYKYLKRRLK